MRKGSKVKEKLRKTFGKKPKNPKPEKEYKGAKAFDVLTKMK